MPDDLHDYKDEFTLIEALIEMMIGVAVIIGGILVVIVLKATPVLGGIVCIVGIILIILGFTKVVKVGQDHQKY
jgi:hypothetical protein